MPCNDWPTGPGSYPVENPINKEMKKRLDLATKLLCGVMTFLTRRGGMEARALISDIYANVPGLDGWWRNHQEEDRKREAHERAMREHKKAEKRQKIKQLQAEIERLEKEK